MNVFIQIIKVHKITLLKRIVGALGTLWLISEILHKLFKNIESFTKYIVVVIIISSIVYAVVYVFRRIKSYKLELSDGAEIIIEYGDLFKAGTDYFLIPVSNCFDTNVGEHSDSIVSNSSILGQYLLMFKNLDVLRNILYLKI